MSFPIKISAVVADSRAVCCICKMLGILPIAFLWTMTLPAKSNPSCAAMFCCNTYRNPVLPLRVPYCRKIIRPSCMKKAPSIAIPSIMACIVVWIFARKQMSLPQRLARWPPISAPGGFSLSASAMSRCIPIPFSCAATTSSSASATTSTSSPSAASPAGAMTSLSRKIHSPAISACAVPWSAQCSWAMSPGRTYRLPACVGLRRVPSPITTPPPKRSCLPWMTCAKGRIPSCKI